MRLKEIHGARQTPGEADKRWLSSTQADLFVWLRDSEIAAFELC